MSSSRPHRHLSDYSRGSSSRSHRALSVTEAVQSLRLTETCGASSPAYPSYASTSDRRRHDPSLRDSGYSESLLDVSAYTRTASPASYLEPSPTFDPAVLSVPDYPSFPPTSYPRQPTSDPASMSYSQTASMSYQSAYPSYRTAVTTSGRSPSYAAHSHSPHSFGGGSYPSSTSSVHSHYGTANSSKGPPFDSLYDYGGSTSGSAYAGYESTRGGFGGYHDRRSSHEPHPAGPKTVGPPQEKPRCYDHGCNGREFSTFSNLLRHQREKSGISHKPVCHRCGAEFTRKTARDGHLAHDKCKQRSPRR